MEVRPTRAHARARWLKEGLFSKRATRADIAPGPTLAHGTSRGNHWGRAWSVLQAPISAKIHATNTMRFIEAESAIGGPWRRLGRLSLTGGPEKRYGGGGHLVLQRKICLTWAGTRNPLPQHELTPPSSTHRVDIEVSLPASRVDFFSAELLGSRPRAGCRSLCKPSRAAQRMRCGARKGRHAAPPDLEAGPPRHQAAAATRASAQRANKAGPEATAANAATSAISTRCSRGRRNARAPQSAATMRFAWWARAQARARTVHAAQADLLMPTADRGCSLLGFGRYDVFCLQL